MTLSGYFYRCSAGESFDSVALAVYGDEKYAADLLNANGKYCGMLVFAGGEELQLPVIENAQAQRDAELAAPWKE